MSDFEEARDRLVSAALDLYDCTMPGGGGYAHRRMETIERFSRAVHRYRAMVSAVARCDDPSTEVCRR